MTLIREIQELASDSTTSLPDLLRKTKILARRLQSPELADWADHELNGYPADAELPSYRVHKTYSRGRFADYGRRADLQIDTNALPERPDWREMATTVYFREPIAYFQELIATPRTADERFDISWPVSAVAWAQHNIEFYDGWTLESAWRVVSRANHVAMLDAVRTRILNFALDLEEIDPDAGEWPAGTPSPIRPEQLVQIVNNTIFSGGTHTVAIGSSGFTQTTHHGIAPGDLVALHNALSSLGVTEDELTVLDQALDADSSTAEETGGVGPATRAWIANAAGKLGSGAAEWAGGQAAGGIYRVLEEPIKAFLGLLGQ